MKVGDIIGGRYKLLSPLAEGGFGKTFVAADNHRPSNPQCVVKFLKSHKDDPQLLENARRLFCKEAEILEKLGSHNQIPQLLAYFEEEGDFFLVQEYVRGHTLSKELIPNQPWEEVHVCQLLYGILQTLAFVHGQGVIHRDVKPDNIIRRDGDQSLVLVDFGTVKEVLAMGGQGNTTVVVGTPGYMPTEQGWGKPRYSSDIYALGMIGLRAATGLRATEIGEDVRTGELIWPAGRHISGELAAVLSSMVRYHFRDRYQTADEALKALTPLLERHGLLASGETSDQWPSANPAMRSATTLPINPAATSDPRTGSSSPVIVSRNPAEGSGLVRAARPALPLEPSSQMNPQDPPIYSPSWLPTEIVPGVKNTTVALERDAHSRTLFEVSPGVHYPPPFIRRYGWMVGAGAAVVLAGGALLGYQAVTRHFRYQEVKVMLDQMRNFKETGDYQQCIQQATLMSDEFSDLHSEAQGLFVDCELELGRQAQQSGDFDQCIELEQDVPADLSEVSTQALTLLGDCWFGKAQMLAAERSFKDAIEAAQEISMDHPKYNEAQVLISQWSEDIIKTAQDTYKQGNLEEAVNIISAIPADTSRYVQAQGLIDEWQKEWEAEQSTFDAVKSAFDQEEWQKTVDEAQKLQTEHWKKQAEPMVQKAQTEISAAERQIPSQPSSSGSGYYPSSGGGYSRPSRPLRRTIPSYSSPSHRRPSELPRDRK